MPLFDNLYIYVVDGSQGFIDNRVDWIDSFFTINDIQVVSVQDMVEKIESRLGKRRRIKNLFIGGHGAPGYQSIGAGAGWDGTGSKSLQLDPSSHGRLRGAADQMMRRLGTRFTKDAIVTLGGCRVGEGRLLLRAVSNAIGGVPVQAGTANQRPLIPGMEGDVVRCKGDSCTNLGGGSWWASPGSWIQ